MSMSQRYRHQVINANIKNDSDSSESKGGKGGGGGGGEHGSSFFLPDA